METLSFVVPCYRSEKTIRMVVDEIGTVLQGNADYDYEVILVNDRSPDNVWNEIAALVKENPRVKALHLARNFGQHAALMAGYGMVSGDFIVTIDDDGQTPVDQVFLLLDRLKEGGFDVVYAEYKERKDNAFRKLGTFFNNWMMEFMIGKPRDVKLTSYFVAKRYIIDKICEYKNPYPYIWGLVLRTTRNIGNALVRHNERAAGESGYTVKKLLQLWVNGATAFSVKPLRISSGFGFLFAFFGFVGLVYTVVDKLLHPAISPGYSALMSVMLIIGGLILVSLGMIGEYIGRMYLCINASPQFVVKETLGFGDAEK